MDAAGNITHSFDGGSFSGTIKNFSINRPIVFIGNAGGGGQQSGAFHELIIYPSNLVQSEVDKEVGHLAWKWALQANLPATHPFKNKRP